MILCVEGGEIFIPNLSLVGIIWSSKHRLFTGMWGHESLILSINWNQGTSQYLNIYFVQTWFINGKKGFDRD